MPRRNNHGSNRHSSTNNALVILTADRFINKDYGRHVKVVQSMDAMLAERLGNGGDLSEALPLVDEDGSFFNEQKSRLISLAEENAKQMKYIKSFSDALNQIRVETTQTDNNNNKNDDDDDDMENNHNMNNNKRDYRQILQQHMEDYSRRNERNGTNSKYDDMVRQVRIKLGEKVENENQDDDLEIMHQPTSANELSALKCPVTGTFFDDPVKNIRCGHTYNRAGLQQLIRLKKKECPIPGCPNKNITDVEDDVEMKMRVEHYKKKMERMKAKQEELDEYNTQYDIDNGGPGLTVIN